MSHRARSFIGMTACAVALLFPASAVAQDSSVNGCRDRIVTELSKLHDEFRSYVFGSREDRDGNVTLVTGGRMSGGSASADEARAGILETKERLTSELIAPLVESYRVLRCRTMNVCSVLRESLGQKGGDITVRSLGCAKQDLTRYEECYLAGGAAAGPDDDTGTGKNDTELMQYCADLGQDSLAFEERVLQLAVGYDTGYRSAAQLAGMMDWVREEIPASYVLQRLRDMVNLLGRLHQIPCFIGQCDHPPE
jgi:hypothetical protein